ncbi:hypothetical protein IHE44_0001386 [Lamprotornis superbus]|uniref:ALMS motif domain-containing protein n=1 Tax=Lamprotornis superbus TaxID=245042 RepID=A0A835NQU3_9PASS|nr:hypothetical protein IHE44_0001386 [Lamprotornis superbus]
MCLSPFQMAEVKGPILLSLRHRYTESPDSPEFLKIVVERNNCRTNKVLLVAAIPSHLICLVESKKDNFKIKQSTGFCRDPAAMDMGGSPSPHTSLMDAEPRSQKKQCVCSAVLFDVSREALEVPGGSRGVHCDAGGSEGTGDMVIPYLVVLKNKEEHTWLLFTTKVPTCHSPQHRYPTCNFTDGLKTTFARGFPSSTGGFCPLMLSSHHRLRSCSKGTLPVFGASSSQCQTRFPAFALTAAQHYSFAKNHASCLKPWKSKAEIVKLWISPGHSVGLSKSLQKDPRGVTQKCWGPDGQRTCTGLQQESGSRDLGAQGRSNLISQFTAAMRLGQESLPSQTTALISPVISAQIEEDKSRGSQPSLPMQALIPQPRACPTRPSLPNHSSAIVCRTFLVLPSRLEIQASLEDTMSPADSPSANQCPGQQRGFASITVTARRVAVGSADLASGPGAGQEPSTVSPMPSTVSPMPSRVPAVLERWPPPAHANQPPSKVSKSCSKLGEEPSKQLFDPGIKEDGVGPQSSDGREKIPPSFLSSVQLQVSQPCPNTIYYLDKSLNVCIDQPRAKCQKMYRSTLSLRLKCSLSGLTADGVDGIANGGPMEERAPRKLPGAKGAPLRSHLSTACTGNKHLWIFPEDLTRQQQRKRMSSLAATTLCFPSKFPIQAVRQERVKGPTEGHMSHPPQRCGQGPAQGKLHEVPVRGTPMLLGSRKRSSTTTPGSPPDSASRETIAAATDGSSNRAEPSKDTSKSKEIQAQAVLKPKMSVSNSVCNIKASSRILREENVHGQEQLLKSNCEFPGSRDRTKELEAQDERERGRRVTLSRVTLSRVSQSRVTLPRACSPGVTWEKNLLTWPQSSSQLGKTPAAPWTLREALEKHNPQFISRSQKRQKRLELMVQLRRAQHREAPPGTPRALPRKLSTSTASRKKQFTIPDPLSVVFFSTVQVLLVVGVMAINDISSPPSSQNDHFGDAGDSREADNLFKPKERVIPEKEMHMRSKRIYDNLPEVKKKQEEKQKRIILQSNRLRVEMFKKACLESHPKATAKYFGMERKHLEFGIRGGHSKIIISQLHWPTHSFGTEIPDESNIMGPLGQEGKITSKGEEGRDEFMSNRVTEIADLALHFLGVTAWCRHTVLLRAAQQLLKACTEGGNLPLETGKSTESISQSSALVDAIPCLKAGTEVCRAEQSSVAKGKLFHTAPFLIVSSGLTFPVPCELKLLMNR